MRGLGGPARSAAILSAVGVSSAMAARNSLKGGRAMAALDLDLDFAIRRPILTIWAQPNASLASLLLTAWLMPTSLTGPRWTRYSVSDYSECRSGALPSSSKSDFASIRSGASNPSVNQP